VVPLGLKPPQPLRPRAKMLVTFGLYGVLGHIPSCKNGKAISRAYARECFSLRNATAIEILLFRVPTKHPLIVAGEKQQSSVSPTCIIILS
jgi:hypothetical protein